MLFKVGDVVKLVADDHAMCERGSILTIIEDDENTTCWFNLDNDTVELTCVQDWPEDFELVATIKSEVTVRAEADMALSTRNYVPLPYIVPAQDTLYRPVLEERKVGKVRVELVDNGFPLALRELAKVMTWAQTAKGYKDHDWQNLPDAEVQLAAAASRHRTDHIKQRIVEGVPISECVDQESLILHKAHELFGVAAQLELMLRGDIK